MSMTTEEAIRNLRDAIRAEVLAEVVEGVRAWWESSGESYAEDSNGAIDDAIITIEGM